MQRHPGNIRMHHLINSYRHKYRKATRSEKASMIQEVLENLKQGGVRFRRRVDNEDLWVEVTDQVAYDKVSHALRGRGSERRAPPRESEAQLAGGVSSSSKETVEEGKGDHLARYENTGSTLKAASGQPPRRSDQGSLTNILTRPSGQFNLRVGEPSAASALSLARLLEGGGALANPTVASLPQRNELLQSVLPRYAPQLGQSTNFIPSFAPIALASTASLPAGSSSNVFGETVQSLVALRTALAENPVDNSLIEHLLLQQLEDSQQRQQLLLTPSVEALLNRLHGNTSNPGLLDQQLRQLPLSAGVGGPLSLNREASALLGSLRATPNIDVQSFFFQSLLQQQQMSQESSLSEVLAMRNNSSRTTGILPPLNARTANAPTPLNMGLDDRIAQAQQQLLLRNALNARGLVAPSQQISDEVLLSLLSRQNNPQQQPNQY